MDFYRGQTITLIIFTAPGTGTDVRGRIFASRLGEYTNATIEVKNVTSTERHEEGSYAFKAKPDGLTLWAIAAGGLIPRGVLGLADAEFKLDELSYIGIIGYPLCYVIWVKPDGPYYSVMDLQQTKGLRFATSSPGAVLSQGNALAIDIMSLDGKVVDDVGEAGKIAAAISNGDADSGVLNFYPGLKYAEKGLIKPLLIVGSRRNEALPGIPTITELFPLSNEQKKYLAAFEAMPIGTPVFGPPGVPQDRLKLLREAFEKVMAREDLRQQLEEESGVWGGHLSGEEATKQIKTMMNDRVTYRKLYNLVQRYLA